MRTSCPDSSVDFGLVAIWVASAVAFISANSHNNSWTVCSRLSGECDNKSGRHDSILWPAEVGKLRPALTPMISLRSGDNSGHESAKRRAHSLVNQTTRAVCGRDSSMAAVDAQVWGMSDGTRTRSCGSYW